MGFGASAAVRELAVCGDHRTWRKPGRGAHCLFLVETRLS